DFGAASHPGQPDRACPGARVARRRGPGEWQLCDRAATRSQASPGSAGRQPPAVARHLPYALPFKGRTPRVGRLNRNAEVSGKVSILAWLVLGLIAGWLAGMLMKGGGYGIVGDIVLGILGALVGGWLTGVLFGQDLMTGFNVVSLIVAVLGAIVLIGISRLLTGGRASTRV